jgi:hypothetical protein
VRSVDVAQGGPDKNVLIRTCWPRALAIGILRWSPSAAQLPVAPNFIVGRCTGSAVAGGGTAAVFVVGLLDRPQPDALKGAATGQIEAANRSRTLGRMA